ncbi:MAG: PAS domain S-box protein [Chloroflexota bacterium]|nr:PAS domain S-box protein [Chloroflexota bacterium]
MATKAISKPKNGKTTQGIHETTEMENPGMSMTQRHGNSKTKSAGSELGKGQANNGKNGSARQGKRDSNGYTESIINSMADVVVITDENFVMHITNPAVERLLGYTAEDIVGKPLVELPMLPPEIRSTLGDRLADIVKEGIRISEIDLVHNDGRRLPFSLSIGIMNDDDGNVLGTVIIGRDTSESKQSEELRQAKAFSDSILQSMPNMLIIMGADKTISYVNDEFARFVGRELDDLIGMSMESLVGELNLLAPESIPIIIERVNRRMETGEALMDVELDIVNANGNIVPAMYSATGIKDAHGEVMGEVVIITDVTERKQTESKLLEEKAFTDSILHSMPDMLIIMGADKSLSYANDEFARFVGRDANDLIGMSMESLLGELNFLTPESIPIIIERVNRRMETGEALIGVELEMLNSKGERVPVTYSASGIKGLNDEVMGEVVIITDVTERKQAESKLLEEKAFTDSILHSMPNMMFILSTDKSISYANDEFARFVGRDVNDLVGMSMESLLGELNFLTPESIPIIMERSSRRMETGEAIADVELEMLNSKGERVPVTYSASGIKGADGEVMGEVVIISDVTERKRAESKLLNEKAFTDSILHSMPNMMFILNNDKSISYANDEFARFVGRDVNDLLGMSMESLLGELNFITPESIPIIMERSSRRMETGEAIADVELEMLNSKGERVPVTYSASGIKGADGEVMGEVVIISDVTERKQAESKLLEEKAFTDSILHSMPNMMFILNNDKALSYANDEFARFVGRDAIDLVGMSMESLLGELNFITPESIPIIMERSSRRMETGEAISGVELEMLNEKGERVPVTYSASGINGLNGEVMGEVVIICDITEEKRLAKEQDKAYRFFEGTVNNIADMVIATDQDLVIKTANLATERLTGFNTEELLGKSLSELPILPPETRSSMDSMLDTIIQQGMLNVEAKLLHKDGRKIKFNTSISAMKDDDGNALGLVILAGDMSKEINAMHGIIELTRKAAEGDLNARANVEDYEGSFKKIIAEVNGLIDAVSSPITESISILERLANNDLSVHVTGDYQGDHAKIKNAVNTAIDNLRELVSHIKNNADGVTDASNQLASAADQAGQATQGIANTSQQVAKGAEDQTRGIQITKESMEQLAKAIDQITQGAQEQTKGIQATSNVVNEVSSASEQVANNAQSASIGSAEAADIAQQGSATVGKTIEGMQKIGDAMEAVSLRITDLGDRSNEIGKIVATIDDIAAQTNLLALNAAIEAARAGEQGRGFAVVADEVRKLAERSSMATKEIADLITGIQKSVREAITAMDEGTMQVHHGNQLAGEAGEALELILKSTVEVRSQIEQISAASEQLNASSNEMVKAIDGVSSIVEQNMAATEQMSANSSEMSNSIETVAGISEENSAATQEISASAEEMSAQVEQVVASSQSLFDMAQGLQNAVSRFNINSNGVKEEA